MIASGGCDSRTCDSKDSELSVNEGMPWVARARSVSKNSVACCQLVLSANASARTNAIVQQEQDI